jgi:hypothetical protein
MLDFGRGVELLSSLNIPDACFFGSYAERND